MLKTLYDCKNFFEIYVSLALDVALSGLLLYIRILNPFQVEFKHVV